mgnify:CR=1 FL=1
MYLDHAFNDLHVPYRNLYSMGKKLQFSWVKVSQIILVFYPVQARHRGVYSHRRRKTIRHIAHKFKKNQKNLIHS